MRVQYQPSKRRPTKLFEAIQRPEYLYRPTKIWRRLRKNSVYARKAVQLAWGLPIEIGPVSHVGVDVMNLGEHDRVVAEAICCFFFKQKTAYDIGANIGQNTSMMALVAGSRG